MGENKVPSHAARCPEMKNVAGRKSCLQRVGFVATSAILIS